MESHDAKERRLAAARKYKAEHRAELTLKHAAYNAAHVEERRAFATSYYTGHRSERIAHCAKWRKANPEKAAAYSKKYEATHTPERQVKNGARRCRRRNGLVALTATEWRRIIELSKGCCYWCKRKAHPITQDHVIPLINGGTHTAGNVVVSCSHCNNRKNAKIITLF